MWLRKQHEVHCSKRHQEWKRSDADPNAQGLGDFGSIRRILSYLRRKKNIEMIDKNSEFVSYLCAVGFIVAARCELIGGNCRESNFSSTISWKKKQFISWSNVFNLLLFLPPWYLWRRASILSSYKSVRFVLFDSEEYFSVVQPENFQINHHRYSND